MESEISRKVIDLTLSEHLSVAEVASESSDYSQEFNESYSNVKLAPLL